MTADELRSLIVEWAAALNAIEQSPTFENFDRYREAAARLRSVAADTEEG